MTTRSTHRPSPAMVVAMIALFVAIGGTAIALPGQNTVNSGDVKNETLKSQDLKDDAAVQSSDVIADSLTNLDLASDSVLSAEIRNGTVGSADISDLSVATGHLTGGAVTSAKVGSNAVGSGDLAPIAAVVDPTPYDFGDQDEGNNDYLYGESIVDCPGGSTVIGGGAEWVGAGNGGAGGDELQAITESHLSSNGWIAKAVSDVDSQDFRAIAYCLSTGT